VQVDKTSSGWRPFLSGDDQKGSSSGGQGRAASWLSLLPRADLGPSRGAVVAIHMARYMTMEMRGKDP